MAPSHTNGTRLAPDTSGLAHAHPSEPLRRTHVHREHHTLLLCAASPACAAPSDAAHVGLIQAEARQAIVEYIEEFYNRQRLHQALGYRSPEEFEKMAGES